MLWSGYTINLVTICCHIKITILLIIFPMLYITFLCDTYFITGRLFLLIGPYLAYLFSPTLLNRKKKNNQPYQNQNKTSLYLKGWLVLLWCFVGLHPLCLCAYSAFCQECPVGGGCGSGEADWPGESLGFPTNSGGRSLCESPLASLTLGAGSAWRLRHHSLCGPRFVLLIALPHRFAVRS